jgi:hypothetical protein
LRYFWWIVQAVGALLFLFLPLWSPESLALAKHYPFLWFYQGQDRHFNLPALLALVGGAMVVISQLADKNLMALEFKGVVTDREFVEAYSEVLESCILLTKTAVGMDEGQLIYARGRILHGIRLVVHHYYDKSEDLDINACYMIAYPAAAAPSGVEKWLKFRDKLRTLDSYGHFLELALWAEDHGDLPRPGEFVLPVEKEGEPNMHLKLLPGAPAAFAMNRVCVIRDTRNLKKYFDEEGKYVNREIVKEELDFFDSQKFRSFASLPLENGGQKKGVVNLQSGRTCIFGKNDCDQNVVTNLLKPLMTALHGLI